MVNSSASKKIVRVAAVQFAPDLDSPQGTLNRVLDGIEQAASRGAQLVVFPEAFIPYFPYFAALNPPAAIGGEQNRLYNNAVTIPGPVPDALSRAAREHRIMVAVGVTERDHGTLYNTQLVFDLDGTPIINHRKFSPAPFERLIWGEGDGTDVKVADSALGRIGTLTCWEHYNPLARFSLMAQHEEIHLSTFIGGIFGDKFRDQTEIQLKNHALESGCFVINSAAWVNDDQRQAITRDPQMQEMLHGGSITAIIGPDGEHLVPPLTEGEGILVADLDFSEITNAKRIRDSVGHYSRPDLFSLAVHSKKTPQLRFDEEPLESAGAGDCARLLENDAPAAL